MDQKSLSNQKVITIISVIFLLISLIFGIQLVRERQLLKQKAATPNGTIFMSLGGSDTLQVGDTLSVPISFQTNSTPLDKGVNVLQVQLKYPNTSAFSTPTFTDNLPAPWSYSSFQRVTPGATETTIYIEAFYNQAGTQAYIPQANETFVTLNFTALAPGTLVLNFDPVESKALAFDQAADVLNIALSPRTYTVSASNTATPTPSVTSTPSATATPTVTTTPVLSSTPSITPNPNFSPTPTSTPNPTSTATNSCGGTCGSNYNCNNNLACINGFCRNPFCGSDTDCVCNQVSSPTPTKRSTTAPTSSAPTVTAYIYPTDIPYVSPTPDFSLFASPTPTLVPSGAGFGSSPLATRIVIVAGIWILVILLILWLIKKYRDSQREQEKVDELVNRFKGPNTDTPPTPPTV
jgi:preprotein translocase subunit SecG